MGVRLLKIAAVYFAIASIVGLYNVFFPTDFGDFVTIVNAGWVTLALAGIIYHVFPKASQTVLAQTYFWLYNIGLAAAVIASLFTIGWLSTIGTVVLLLGLLVFAISICKDVTS